MLEIDSISETLETTAHAEMQTMSINVFNGIRDESWPVQYDNEELRLEVTRSGRPHDLVVSNKMGFQYRHPWKIFFRFFNELVWFYGISIERINGGNGEYCANVNYLPSDDSYAIKMAGFQQQVFNDTQHLALGFYREGVSSGSPYYKFLCYAKILEIPFKDGKEKGEWIDQAIPELEDSLAVTLRDRKPKLLDGKTLGAWLREDGRHALSHANVQGGNRVRDPNCFQDWDDIKWGNEAMHELVMKVVTEKLSVPKA